MAQRSLVTLLAALGGILIIIGGILGFILGFGPYGYGPRIGDNGSYFAVLALLAIIFGIIILVFSGYTHLRSADQSVVGGLVMMILGLITWVVAGAWLLVAIGSFLAILAGLILLILIVLGEPSGRARWSS